MLTDIEMMTISNLDFLHYMTAVSHEMSDEPQFAAQIDDTHREMMERYQHGSRPKRGGLFSKLFK